jgi:hypothetical protein
LADHFVKRNSTEKTTNEAHASSSQSKTLKTTKKRMLLRINHKPKRTCALHICSKMNKNTIQRVQCLPFVGLSGSRAYFTCGTALGQSFYITTDLLAIPTRGKHDIPRLNKARTSFCEIKIRQAFPKNRRKKKTHKQYAAPT